jgi:hypothetical protein
MAVVESCCTVHQDGVRNGRSLPVRDEAVQHDRMAHTLPWKEHRLLVVTTIVSA